MSPDLEPRTEAGKTMMREHTSASPHMIRHVLAIEREARALGPDHSDEIAKNLAAQRELETQAARTTVGPLGRCFEMADGRLLVVRNPQPDDGRTVLHVQWILPITPEDAEDFYGWTPRT